MGHYDSCRHNGNGIDAYNLSKLEQGIWPYNTPQPDNWNDKSVQQRAIDRLKYNMATDTREG